MKASDLLFSHPSPSLAHGRLNPLYGTFQSDLFTSGVAAEIGVNAFGVWMAIKSHADFDTGEAWPGMRRLAEVTGLSLGAVSSAVKKLTEWKLLRIVNKGSGKRGNRYVARERMDVYLGKRVVLCTIVLDYVPNRLREQINKINEAMKVGEMGLDLVDCEIIPGKGFSWDARVGVLRAAIPAREITVDDTTNVAASSQAPLVQKVLAMQRKAQSRKRPVEN